MKSQKKILEAQLTEILKQEGIAIEEKHRPIFEKKYVGKYFKCKNGYGNGQKEWWLYTYVISINSVYPQYGTRVTGTAGVWQFQKTSDEIVEIKKNETYLHGSSFDVEISQSEFYAAWNKLMKHVDSLPG